MNRRQRIRTLLLAPAGTAAACLLPLVAGPYVLELASRTLALAVLAASVTLVTGHAGLPTLGQVAPYAAGAYTAADLAGRAHLPAVAMVVAAAAAGLGCAAVTLPAMIRTRGIVTLMVSLAIGQLTSVVATAATSLTGGGNGLVIPAPPAWWTTPPLASDTAGFLFVVAVAAVLLTGTALILQGRAGLLLAGVRQDEVRMRATGHPVARYLAATYLAAGALAGAGGALLVVGQTFISVGDFGFNTAALVLLAATIGGIRSVAGAIAGAALIVASQDWLAGPWPGHGPLILGALFAAAVYLLPAGAAAVPARLIARLRRIEKL